MLKPLPCVGSPGLWRRCPHRRAAQRPHCIPVSRPQRPPALAACSRLTGPLKEVMHHCCHGPGSSCVVAAHLAGSRAARGLPLRGFRQPGRGSAEPRAGRGRAGCLGRPAPAPILTRDGHRLRPFATTVRVHRTPEPYTRGTVARDGRGRQIESRPGARAVDGYTLRQEVDFLVAGKPSRIGAGGSCGSSPLHGASAATAGPSAPTAVPAHPVRRPHGAHAPA